MYQKPLTIDSNDPICSATSLEGTVIGILFEKSGREIKDAIDTRLKVIAEEIERKQKLVSPIRDFLRDKSDLIIKIEEAEQKREKIRLKEQKPYQDQVRKLEDEIERICEQMTSKTDEIDGETIKFLREQEKKFMDGWKELGDDFKEIVETESSERWDIPKVPAKTRASQSSSSSTNSSSTSSCSISGPTNYSEYDSSHSVSFNSVHASIRVSNKLRQQVQKYTEHFERIKRQIEQLVLEQRRLEMICRNIDSDRKFKLNLVQLSAFGFEDVEIR